MNGTKICKESKGYTPSAACVRGSEDTVQGALSSGGSVRELEAQASHGVRWESQGKLKLGSVQKSD